MTVMSRLERAVGRYAVPNLTLYLVCGQAAFLVMAMARPERFIPQIVLDPGRVLHEGEWWRLLTFVLYPPVHPFPLISGFVLYFFYMMGTALESNWGEFRFNLYLLIAYLASVGAAFLAYAVGGEGEATNAYIGGSVFLAFAMLYPEFVTYVFFILPVPIKWLARVTWVIYGARFLMGDWMTRMLIVASVLNFLLFFGREIVQAMRSGRRRMGRQVRLKVTERPDAAFHTCAACGINDRTHPKMDFRYCPGCGGQLAYCTEHLNAHEHRVVARKDG